MLSTTEKTPLHETTYRTLPEGIIVEVHPDDEEKVEAKVTATHNTGLAALAADLLDLIVSNLQLDELAQIATINSTYAKRVRSSKLTARHFDPNAQSNKIIGSYAEIHRRFSLEQECDETETAVSRMKEQIAEEKYYQYSRSEDRINHKPFYLVLACMAGAVLYIAYSTDDSENLRLNDYILKPIGFLILSFLVWWLAKDLASYIRERFFSPLPSLQNQLAEAQQHYTALRAKADQQPLSSAMHRLYKMQRQKAADQNNGTSRQCIIL